MESLNFLRKYRNDSFEPHKHRSWNRDKTVFNWITLARVSELEIMKCSTPIRLQQPPGSPSAEQQSTKWKRNDITLSWRLLEKWNLFLINFMIFRCVVKAYVLGRRWRRRSVCSGERWLKETGKAVGGEMIFVEMREFFVPRFYAPAPALCSPHPLPSVDFSMFSRINVHLSRTLFN